MSTDLYEILGVTRSASADEIKRAYRRLAREHHPDANPDDPAAETRFKELTGAYEILSDPERRARYDQFGTADPSAVGFGAGGLGDIFEAFFGSGSPFGGSSPFGANSQRAGPRVGNDLEVVVEVDFETAVLGGQASVEVAAPVPCTACEGRGAASGTDPQQCATCGGAGQVRQVRRSILGQMITAVPCSTCHGYGEVIADPCPHCHGDGVVTESRSYTLDVPAGIDHGATLRLSGRGAAGPRGGGFGDLYVHVSVRPHPRFRREGYDLTADLVLSMSQAALGTEVEYETLEGIEELSIRPGTQSGEILRLRGHGVPRLRARGRGDLLVRVVVETPNDLSVEEKELLRRFAELRGEELTETDSGWLGRIRSAFS